MTQPTLYQHDIIATITALIAAATIIVTYTVVNAIYSIPSPDSVLIQSNTVYVTSCSSPISMIVGSLLVLLGVYFLFNLLSRGRLI